MLNRDNQRLSSPTRLPGLPTDPLLRHGYGGQLESAAEAFLVQAFAQNGQGPLGEGSASPVLVSAAMHILNRSAWTQPSDEQIKAAMYLSQPSSPRSHDADEREAA